MVGALGGFNGVAAAWSVHAHSRALCMAEVQMSQDGLWVHGHHMRHTEHVARVPAGCVICGLMWFAIWVRLDGVIA
jgi:hypothetical protein